MWVGKIGYLATDLGHWEWSVHLGTHILVYTYSLVNTKPTLPNLNTSNPREYTALCPGHSKFFNASCWRSVQLWKTANVLGMRLGYTLRVERVWNCDIGELHVRTRATADLLCQQPSTTEVPILLGKSSLDTSESCLKQLGLHHTCTLMKATANYVHVISYFCIVSQFWP